MKNNRSLIAAALFLLSFLFYLSSRNAVPPIPADALHNGAVTNDSCNPCHGPGMQAPLKPGHPPKEQCLTCHKRKA